jgi:3-oxoacyl-[acyl-carrier-protein] synthase II
MRVLFVYPRFEKFLSSLPELDSGVIDYFLGKFTTPPSLGIPILASLTPAEVELQLVDDNACQPLDFGARVDLVAINCFTPQATRAFEIADQYRARGTKVIMGGFFPSFMVDECLTHADAVNIGEGEPTWAQILEDARNGRLKRRYEGGCRADLHALPAPKREIFYQNDFYDWDEDLVQVTRGCSYTCAMCAIPAHMGNRIRFRPIEQVVAEVRALKHENVYLADDTLFFPHRKMQEYARELFQALEPLEKKFFVSSTMALNTDTQFLDLAARAGVRNFYCTLNVDPFSLKALKGEPRERQMLIDLVKAVEERGIRFFASCALGRDWDDPHIADQILELFSAANIHTAEFFLFTPYPGSVQWERMLRQNRIFDFNWSHYNGAHVVAKPLNSSPEELRGQFIRVWREFFQAQKGQYAAHLEPATWDGGVQVLGKPMQRQNARCQAVVTGLGVLSPIGLDAATVTRNLKEGRHGLAPVKRFNTGSFRTELGGELKGFSPEQWLSPEELRTFDDPYLHYAIAAARQALRDSGLHWGQGTVRNDVGLVLATCNGGLASAEAEYAWKHGRSSRPFDERMNLHAQYFGFGKALANALGLGGETWIVTTACSSGTVALGLAQTLIQRGYYETVLVGGADVLCVANVSGFDALKATAPGRMAPFSIPHGLNIGEGACFWVVETMERALLRHARCHGRLAGHATTCDAFHPTTPDPRGHGVTRTLSVALADSGMTLEEVGCINGHGSGTEANDRAETRGVAAFIKKQPIPLVSTKSFFGHCMGVTGLLEATSQLLAMNAGFIPPTLNFGEPRPGCTLDYVPNQARQKPYRVFISANYAFGGNNAATVISAWDAPVAQRERSTERVVLTGLGTVTSAGLGISRTLDSLRAGTVCLSPVAGFPLRDCRSKLLGQVPRFKGADVDRRIDFESLNNISRFAVAASRLALEHAGLRITPNTGDEAGVVMGVCNGPSEMGHMDSVFSSETFSADVTSFSNITANSTAGWVANALYLKGVNCSLSPGPHAGLQSLAYAYDALVENRARSILAGAADEVYAQTYYNYDGIGFLYSGEQENDYRLRPDFQKQKVLGEGAAMICMETLAAARARGARVLAEMLGYGMSMDADGFLEPNLKHSSVVRAVRLALERGGVEPVDVGLIIWSPQGNVQDLKILRAGGEIWGEDFRRIPLVTTTFNTGFIESASILVSLAAALEALGSPVANGCGLWPQRCGIPEIDSRSLPPDPKYILALATTDLGYNFAAVFSRGTIS